MTPRFLPEKSSPEQGHYFWAYTIEITNKGTRDGPTQDAPLAHHRRARAGAGGARRRRGGRAAAARPGELFEYTSGVPLPTASGFMVGSYSMVTER